VVLTVLPAVVARLDGAVPGTLGHPLPPPAWSGRSERHPGREQAVTRTAARHDSAELHGAHFVGGAAGAPRPAAARRSGEGQGAWLAVPLGPLCRDIGDQGAVVTGGERQLGPAASAMSVRCIQVSRVRMTSVR
jgi:hypothetical protein